MKWVEHLRGLAKIEDNHGKRIAFDTSAEKIEQLVTENEKLKKGIIAVRELINESYGVGGLHENGDMAAWGELEQGGALEEWLLAFNEAEDV